jgi:hypothetical protein
MTWNGSGWVNSARRSTISPSGSELSLPSISSTAGSSDFVRRAVNAPATSRRSREWSVPYVVSMFSTETQGYRGHSAVITPSRKVGQWRRGSLDTRGRSGAA